MNRVFDVAFAYPTVIFTVLLCIALVYWLFVILGALDIHTGGAKLGTDVGDVGTEVGHAGVKAGMEVGDASTGVATILTALGLRRVPITISISLISLFGWLICLFLMLYVSERLGLPRWLGGTAVLIAAVLLALPPSSLVARPLAPFFAIHEAKRSAEYVGTVCTVTTSAVNDRFGQARIEEGGDVLNVQVRCDRENALGRSDKALILAYDDARHAYLVEPMANITGERA